MEIGIAVLLYGVISWIQESMARARMRKGLEYIKTGIDAFYARQSQEIKNEGK